MNLFLLVGDVFLDVSDDCKSSLPVFLDECNSSLQKEDSSFLFWDGWGEDFFSSPSFVLYCLLLFIICLLKFTICLVLFKKGRTRCSDVVSLVVSLVVSGVVSHDVSHDVLDVVPRDVSGVVSNLYM